MGREDVHILDPDTNTPKAALSSPLQGPHTLLQTLALSKGVEGNLPTPPCLGTAILVQRSARRILSLV